MKSNVFGIETVFSQAEELLKAAIPLDVVDVSTGEQPEPRTDKETIRMLLEAYGDSDLVISLGGEDGIVALVVAPEEGGHESLRLLMDKVDLPVGTPIVNPGNGRTYILYRFEGTPVNSQVDLAPGLALAANRQYIVVPESNVTDRSTGWWKNHPTDAEVAPVPNRLAAFL